MKRVKNWQRYLAAFMAAMMMFSCVNVTAFAATGSESQDGTKWTVTTAELVAGANPGVAEFIMAATAEAIKPGKTYEAEMPADAWVDAEVAANGTTAVITANAVDGWVPVEVVIKKVDASAATWDEESFSVVDEVYTASVSVPKDDAFVAEVSYTLSVTVDNADDEVRLVNLAAKLKEAKERMDEAVCAKEALAGVALTLGAVADAIPEGQMGTFAGKIGAVLRASEAMTTVMEGYDDAFKAKFHWDNGADVQATATEAKAAVVDLYEYIMKPENYEALETMMNFMGLPLSPITDALDELVNEDTSNDKELGALTVVCADTWDEFLDFTPGFTGVEDKNLDAMVAALTNTEAGVEGVYTDVATKTVSYKHSVLMVTVTVNGSVGYEKVKFGAHKDVGTKALVPLTAEIPVAATASDDVVKEKVAAKAAEMTAQWYGSYNEEQFTVGAPEKEDATNWTVTYAPKSYDVTFVTFGSETDSYPYGTVIELSRHTNSEKAWVYTVGGTGGVKQGTTLTVAGDVVITRTAKNAEATYSVLNILAKDTQYALTDVQKAVLSSPAVVSDSVVYSKPAANVNVVNNNDYSGYVVNAENYVDDAGTWYPVSIVVMKETAVVDVAVGGTVGTWTLPAEIDGDTGYFTHVDVTYAKVIEADAADELALPAELKADVDEQKELLNDAKTVYEDYLTPDVLDVLKYDELNTLKLLLGKDAQKAVTDLLNNGWNATGADEPLVYSHMKAAAEVEWKLGTCIDKGYFAAIQEQVALFADNMRKIVKDENFTEMLETAGYADKKQQVEDLCTEMEELSDSFHHMDARFDQSSGAFAELVNTLDAAEAADLTYTGEDNGIKAYAVVMAAAPGYGPTVITVSVEGTNGEYEGLSKTLIGDVSEGTINAVVAEMKAQLLPAELEAYYFLDESENNQIVYSRKAYTVEIVDNGFEVASQEYKYGDKLSMSIPKELPATAAEVYYKYYLGDAEIVDPTGNFWFDLSDFGNDGVITITRKAINKAAEKFDNFIAGLNDAMSSLNGMASFVPVMGQKGYESIVLQISADQKLDTAALTEAVAAAFISMSYDYIGVDVGSSGRQSFKGYDEASESTKLDPQAMVNMMLNSGLSNDVLMSAVNKDGSINHLVLNDQKVGGKLMESKLYLGNGIDDYNTYNFYVTLTAASADKMKDLRGWLDRAEGYVDFGLVDGKVSVEATVPQTVFSAYLAVQIMAGMMEWEDVVNTTLESEVDRVMKALEGKDIPTLTTADIEELAGVDLGTFAPMIDKLLSTLQGKLSEGKVVGTFPDSATWAVSAKVDIKDKIGDMLGDFDVTSLFSNTELSVPFAVSVTNYGDLAEVEALVVEVPELNTDDPVSQDNAAELLNTVKFVDDIEKVLSAAGTPVYVMLLQDYEGDLTVNRTAVLDLNGMTVDGDIAANSELTVVSRVLNAAEAGAVTGELSGKINLAAGTYTADVSAMVKNGYALVEGTVVNEYFTVSEEGNATVVTLNLEALMAQLDQGNLQTLMLDVLSDALLNVEAYASVSVEGNTLYDLNLDVVKLVKDAYGRDFEAVAEQLLAQVDVKAAEAAFKAIFNEVADKAKIKAAIKDGGELASFDYSVANWAIVPALGGADGPSVTIKSGAVQNKVLVINTLPLNDAQKDTVSKLYSAITDLVDVNNRSFTLGKITYSDKNLSWSGSAKADVTIDLTQGEDASDYVTVLALILANNAPASEKNAFVSDILYYYNNEWSEGLEARFNSLKVSDLVNALDKLHEGEKMTTNLKELIAQLMDGSNTKYLKQLVNETVIPEGAKLPGQTANYMNFSEMEKIAELEDIYDIVLAMTIKMAEGVNAVLKSDDVAEQAKVEAFLNQHLNDLYGDASETLSYRSLEMKVTLKLFADEYVSTVDQAVEMIDALDEHFTEEEYDEFLESLDNNPDSEYLTKEYLGDLLEKVAAIRALIDTMSADAKDMVEENCVAFEKLAKAEDYLKRHVDVLEDIVNVKIGEVLKWADTIEGYTDLIDYHAGKTGDKYNYDEDRAALIALIAEIEEFKQIAENADITDYAINEEAVNAAVDYFTYWGGVFGDGEFAGGANELGKVINAIVAAVAMDDVDTEAKMNALLAAQAALEALGPNAQSYVKAKTENTLVEELADFDFSNMLWITEIAPQTYTGKAIKPEIKVYEGLKLLQEKVDYTLSYKNNTKAFEFDDAFKKTYVEPYNVAKADYETEAAEYAAAEDNYNAKKAAYDAAAQDVKDAQAAMKGLKRGTEEYNAAKAAYDEEVKAKSEASKAMSAAKSAMTKAKSEMNKVKSVLTKAENKLASKAPAVIVNFKKNYTGQAYRYFEINRIDLTEAENSETYCEQVGLEIQDVTVADGTKVSAIKPVVTLNGKKISPSEYNVYVSTTPSTGVQALEKGDKLVLNNPDGSKYYMILAAKDVNFTGNYIAEIDIAGYLMSKATIGKIAPQNYADWADGIVTPDVTVTYGSGSNKVTLEPGEDGHYTVSYKNNTGAGTATVIITGTGNEIDGLSFVGTKTATFKINGIKLNTKMVQTNGTLAQTYTGNEIELIGYSGEDQPWHYKLMNGTTALVEGEDFAVDYQKNVNKGTATVIFAGMGNYTGTVKKTFKINAADLNNAEIVVEDAVEYSKSGAKAAVTVTFNGKELVEGKDYTLTYKNNKKVSASEEEISEATAQYLQKLWAYGDAFDAYNNALADYNADRTNADLKAAMNDAKVAMNAAKAAESAAYKELQKLYPTVTVNGKGNFTSKITEGFAIVPADFSEMVGVAKDVMYKEKANNYKTTFTVADSDGKKLSTSDYDSKNFAYEVKLGDEWVPVENVLSELKPGAAKNAILSELMGADYLKMRVVVSAKEGGNYYNDVAEKNTLTIEYRLYTQMITKAKIDRNTKAVFVYDRYEQAFVANSDLMLTYNGDLLWMLGGEYVVDDEMIIADETNAQYKVVEIKDSWVLPGTATAEIVGLNEFGGSKKITFRIQKNSAAVSALDDRIHFLENYADTQTMFFGGDSENLMLYTATPIVLF